MKEGFISKVLSMNVFPKLSMTALSIEGAETCFSRHKSHVTYSVLEGSLVIETQDEYFPLSAGQNISFPPDTYYRKTGVAIISALDSPPFDPTSLEILI